MKNPMRLFMFCLLGLAANSWSQDAWHDRNGNPIPDSSSRKSVQDFGGMLLITPDADWREKWDTSPETIPQFREASEARNGDRLFILTFFSNPGVGPDGKTDITCDLIMFRPDGSRSADQSDVPCFQVPLTENPRHLFLAAAVIGYLAEPNDLRGEWTVEMTLKDKVRAITVPLKTSFTVK